METRIKKTKRHRLSDKEKNVVVLIVSYLFIVLFLYAAANKLLDFQKFKVQLGQSPLLTDFAIITAWSIPTIEILISIMLIFKRTLLAGLYASFSMMILFTTYIIVILNFAERVPCSCGGILDQLGWTEHLVFNIFFIVLGLTAIILKTNSTTSHK